MHGLSYYAAVEVKHPFSTEDEDLSVKEEFSGDW
jgi:hypothetical protein